MEKQNGMLRLARMRRGWTQEYVSGCVGVSCQTYNRWESGVQKPRLSSLAALCRMFSLSPAELGFVHALSDSGAQSHLDGQGEPVRLDQKERCDSEQACSNTQNWFALLETWTVGIKSCWRWYMAGGQAELEQVVPGYLTRLLPSVLQSGPGQMQTASLTSQAYQLIALLYLQTGDFVSAEVNATQALVYSQLAQDGNMYVAAQIRLAEIYSARKRIGSALNAYNSALYRVNKDNSRISPLLHSWIFAGLAEIQATMGREAEALQLLNLAIAVFPDRPEEDICASYAQCDRSMLYLYQGQVFLRLGQLKHAWSAFARVDDLKPVPAERIRADFLRYRTYTSILLGNMIQSCVYLEAATKAAQEIHSDLVLGEIYMLYEHMLAIWGRESRVKNLAFLFQIKDKPGQTEDK